MKMRMRVLSIITCLALLISAAPSGLRLSAGLASEAEVEAAQAEAREPVVEEPEEVAPTEAEEPADVDAEPSELDAMPGEAIEQSGDAELPDAPEVDADVDADAEAEESAEGEPVEEAEAIDYSADAGASPAFAAGCAEVILDGVAVYEGVEPDAQVLAKLDRGVVFAVGRSDAGQTDHIEILFNAGPERGVDRGWVEASALRPMEPEQEVPAFAAFCADLEDVLYPEELAGLPLARISCAYPEAASGEPQERGKDSAEFEETEQTEAPEQEHPVIDWEQPEEFSTMPLPAEEALFQLEDVAPEAEESDLSLDIASFDAQPVIALESDSLKLGVGESFDLAGTGFVSCTADEGARIRLTYTVARGNCISVSDAGVVFAASAGSATLNITETYSGVNRSLTVTVQANPTSVSMRDSMRLGVGMSADLNITFPEGTYSGFRFRCEPEGIVEVSQSGKVTAVAPGTTTITLKTNNGLTDTCFVSVTSGSVIIEADSEIVIALDEEGRKVGARAIADGEEIPCDFLFEVTEGADIVQVDPKSGVLTPLNLGIATVTVSAAGTQSAECVVRVETSPDSVWLRSNELKLGVGETYQISDGEDGIIALSPGSHISSYGYRTSDANIVSVSDTGLLKANRAGTATIWIDPSSMNDPLELAVTVAKAATSIKLSSSEITLRPGESREIRVSFPSGGYSSYSLRILASGEEAGEDEDEDEDEDSGLPITVTRESGDTWTVQADATIAEGGFYTLLARAASGAEASCIVKLMPGPSSEEDIEIKLTKTVLGIGEPGGKITASIADGVIAASGFTYKSSNPNVLSVDAQGNLTAYSVSGEDGVTITATATVPGAEGYASAESEPIVVVSYPTKFQINPGKETLRLGVGDSYPLCLGEEEGDPDGIMGISPAGARTQYSYVVASGGSYADVTSDGVITARKAGTMKLRVLPASGPNPTPQTLTVSVSKAASAISLSQSSLRIGVGLAAEQLTVSFPSKTYSRYSVASSDESVLQLSQSGNTISLTPVGAGRATVTVSTAEQRCTDSCLVEVVDPSVNLKMDAPASIGVDEKGRKVTASFTGEALDAKISYRSNNADVLDVNAATGELTAKAVGVATVSAYLNYRGDGRDPEFASQRIQVVPGPKKISLEPASLTLRVDEVYRISDAEGGMIMLDSGSHASYTYVSNDPKVASVSADGEIKGLKAGSCGISITAQNGTMVELPVKIVKDFTLKASKTELGVGMRSELSVSDAPGGADISYICEPEGSLEFYADGSFRARMSGTAAVYAQAGSGANAKFSNAVMVKILPAPAEEQILFSSESVDRVSPNQTGAKVSASCAPGTMAELGYRLGEGAPLGVYIDNATGALTIGGSGAGTSFTVEAYDRNNGTVRARSVLILARGELSELKQSSLQLVVGETYAISDGPDGIIRLNAANASGSYKFKSSAGKVATVSAYGLITAKKAGSAKITITSADDKSNKAVLSVKVVKDSGSVSLNPGVLTLGLGMSGKLTPSSAALRLSSMDEEIATVDPFGNVKAVSVGETTVVATDPRNGRSDTALVRVVPAPTGVEFELDEIVMGKGEKNMKAVARIVPAEGYAPAGTIVYEMEDSSEEKYVRVNKSTGALTARAKTPADEPVTVRAYIREYPSLSATMSVTVVAKTSVGLTVKSIKLGKGNTYQLRDYIPEEDLEDYALDDEDEDEESSGIVKLSPEEARANTTFSYKSTNAKVLSVSSTGLIQAVGTGKAKIRISTQSNRSASLTVQVLNLPDSISLNTSSLKLGEGARSTLKVSFPKNTYDSYSFTSSDSEIAEVDPSSGVVEAIAAGEAIITVRTEGGLTANCRVAVLPAASEIQLTLQRGGRKIELSDGESLTLGVGEKNLVLSAAPEEGSVGQFRFASSATKKLSVNKTSGKLTVSKTTGDESVELTITDVSNEDIAATIYVDILKKPTKNSQLTLSPSSIVLGVGESLQIAGEDEGDGQVVIELSDGYAASYTYKSNNTKVVTVSSAGLIQAIGTGSARVRITTQNSSVYKDLSVMVYKKATGMQIPPAMQLGSGMEATIMPSFTPGDALGHLEASSNSDKLSVSVDSSTNRITLKAASVTTRTNATITARLAGTDVSDTCCVTLLPAPAAGGVEFDYENMPAAVWENGGWRIRVGRNEKGVLLAAKCSDSNAMSGFTYSVDGSPSGLKVNPNTGELTATVNGSYTVTATSIGNPAARASAQVEVVDGPEAVYFHTEENHKSTSYALQMGVGEQYRIDEYRKDIQTGRESGIVVLEPAASSASYTYAASAYSNKTASTTVLSVDKNTGVITAKKEGTAYVRITTQNSKYRIMTVNVVPAPEAVTVVADPPEVGENSSGRIELKFTPAGSCSQAISYVSSNPSLLELSADGYFETHELRSAGNPEVVTVTATTRSGIVASGQVTVLPHPTKVEFAEPEYEVGAGMQLATAPGPFPAGQKAQRFSYASQNPGIATIDAMTGVITGVSDGTATITITANPGKSYAVSGEATVTVVAAPERISYEGMGLPDVLRIAKGDIVAIPEPQAYSASGKPIPAGYSFALKTATDKTYLTIDGSEMTAVRSGKDVVITVSAQNSTKEHPITTELTVRVYDEVPGAVELYLGDRKVNDARIPMYVNQNRPTDSIALTARVSGANVNYGGLKFSSSQPSLVQVSAGGVVSVSCGANGKAPSGTAVITATANSGGIAARCTIEVGELCESPVLRTRALAMQEGEKEKIDIGYTPTGSGMRMRYVSSNPQAVSVDASGNVTAVGGGEATISITGQYGWSGEVTVSVLYNPDDIRLPLRRLYMQPGESVELTPELSRSGIAPAKVNVYTSLRGGYEDIVSITKTADASQESGTAASYTVEAVGSGSVELVFTTYNGLSAALEIVVSANGWAKDPSGFGWDEDADLYLVRGDTAELIYGLSTSAYTAEGGFSVEVAPGGAGILQMQPDGSVKALAVGTASLQLVVGGQVTNTVQIHVIDPVAPKLWYGPELSDPVRSTLMLDIGIEGVDPGNHTIRIEKLPAPQFDEYSVLLGTYNVTIGDESILEFDRTQDQIHTRELGGKTTVTVETFDNRVSVEVTVMKATVYRALLISEYNGRGAAAKKLPFSGMNADNMEATMRRSSIDGVPYQIRRMDDPYESEIESAFQTFFADTKDNDISVIYVVAHGHMGSGSAAGQYCFSLGEYSTKDASTYVTDTELMNWIQTYIKGRVVLLLDSCNSGGFISHQKGRGLYETGNVAVITAQVASKTASFYVGPYKGVNTYEFFTRALHIGLGYQTYAGVDDDWNDAANADENGDGMISIEEIFEHTQRLTINMVDKYCWTTYFDADSKYGFKSPGLSTKEKASNWRSETKKAGGLGQVPQSYIPSAMKDLVFYGLPS